MSLHFEHYDRSDVPSPMLVAARSYENKFGIEFSAFTYFSEEALVALHKEGPPLELEANVTVASATDKKILREIKTLTDVANTPNISSLHRMQYRYALESVYRALQKQPAEILSRDNTLCVGIEREGRILAEALGWMAYPHAIHPNGKRIPYQHDLLVGLTDIPSLPQFENCVIIDGAIASGATLVAMMNELTRVCSSFHIFSVHGTAEGLRAIVRAAALLGVNVHVTVGHVTQGINDHFYALDPSDPVGKRVMIGDIGDIIS